MGYYDRRETHNLSHWIKLAAVVLVVSWLLNATAVLTLALGPWLIVIWLIIYGRLWLAGTEHQQAVADGTWHPDLSSHNSWPVTVLDSMTASHAGMIDFGIAATCMVTLIGLYVGGLRYGLALLCFWSPLFFLPVWLEHVGLLTYHMGGTVAWVEHFPR